MPKLVSLVDGHKRSSHPLYTTWSNMIARCSRPSNRAFRYYGQRGIRVCERWRTSFEDFVTDVGPKPSPRHSIDRINVNGDYEPNNVRWATSDAQQSNRRTSDAVREHLGSDRSAALPLLWAARRRFGSHAALGREIDADDGLVAKLLYADRKPGRSLALRCRDAAGVPIESWDEPLSPDVDSIPEEWRIDGADEPPSAPESGPLPDETPVVGVHAVKPTGT